MLLVTAFKATSKVFTLSTAGIKSPPRSVASLIFLQEINQINKNGAAKKKIR